MTSVAANPTSLCGVAEGREKPGKDRVQRVDDLWLKLALVIAGVHLSHVLQRRLFRRDIVEAGGDGLLAIHRQVSCEPLADG